MFTATFGTAWFAGSFAVGILYGISRSAVVAFSIATQVAAIPLFVRLTRAQALG